MFCKDVINNFNLNKGDVLLIASDVTRILYISLKNKNRIDLNDFIDFFYDAIGDNGTLLFPTYNWDFCEGNTFDIVNSPSQTGALSSIALKRDDFKRTRHPIYSFAVKGKYADFLYNLRNKSAFGKDSPFAFLHENKAKMLIMDLDYQRSFTFVHYVEETLNVHYRYKKVFNENYIDENGNMSNREYDFHVRNLEKGIVTNINPIGKILELKGIAERTIIEGIPFILIMDLAKAFKEIENDIKYNAASNLFKVE